MSGLCPQYTESQRWCPFYDEERCKVDRNAYDCVLALGVASLAILASVQIGVTPPTEAIALVKGTKKNLKKEY